MPTSAAARFAVREGLIAVALAPLLVVGFIVFWLPYRLTDWISRRGTLDEEATIKVIGGFVVYSLWIGLLGWLAWRALGPRGALLALATLPIVAFASLFAVERETAVLRAVRGWLAVRRAPASARARLGRTRDEIVEVFGSSPRAAGGNGGDGVSGDTNGETELAETKRRLEEHAEKGGDEETQR